LFSSSRRWPCWSWFRRAAANQASCTVLLAAAVLVDVILSTGNTSVHHIIVSVCSAHTQARTRATRSVAVVTTSHTSQPLYRAHESPYAQGAYREAEGVAEFEVHCDAKTTTFHSFPGDVSYVLLLYTHVPTSSFNLEQQIVLEGGAFDVAKSHPPSHHRLLTAHSLHRHSVQRPISGLGRCGDATSSLLGRLDPFEGCERKRLAMKNGADPVHLTRNKLE
jgi:hypothetical protein